MVKVCIAGKCTGCDLLILFIGGFGVFGAV